MLESHVEELVSKKVNDWISRIPTHMEYMENATYYGDQSFSEVFGSSLKDYLSNGDNWELQDCDPASYIDEFELRGDIHFPGDAGEINRSLVQRVLSSGVEYCDRYTFIPKDDDLCEHVRLEVYVYNDEVICWTIIED